MTPVERKALLFLASVGLLGIGVRIVGAPGDVPRAAESVAEQRALDAQLAAVDRALAEERGARSPRRSARLSRGRDTPRAVSRAGDGATDGSARSRPTTDPTDASDGARIDVDVADARALDALPGIGPTLARRIVDDRAQHGTFGSLAALERVRGVGPRLRARVAPYVTFSASPRPTSAGDGRRALP